MDSLFVEIVPTFYRDLSSAMAMFAEFFAGGVLIAFLVWVLAFAIGEVFGMLEFGIREEG